MAEEEEDRESARGSEAGEAGLDPEEGPTQKGNVLAVLRETEFNTLHNSLSQIVWCFFSNNDEERRPNVKLLVNLAARLQTEEEIPEEEYTSLAELLMEQLGVEGMEAGE